MRRDTNETSSSASGGIGFCGLLTIVFITLKLCGVINWSWIWVLSPLWIPVPFFLALALVILIGGIVLDAVRLAIKTKKKKNRESRFKE